MVKRVCIRHTMFKLVLESTILFKKNIDLVCVPFKSDEKLIFKQIYMCCNLFLMKKTTVDV